MSHGVNASPADRDHRLGFAAAASAYVMWGFLPLYLKLVAFADVREVLGQRILWAAPAALGAALMLSGWKRGLSELGSALRPAMLSTLAASSLFIFVNWGLYVWLVLNERVIESALAYFLAPLVSVAVGVVFFRERITGPQLVAIASALAGVVVQGFALGAPPWLALLLCATWSVYAVIRKRAAVTAAAGLFVECMVLAPVAGAFLWWAARSGPLAFQGSWSDAVLLALAGPATALPLMAFAFGARRVSFTTLGLLQFVAPTLQFLSGVFLFAEPFTALRLASFGLIWLGLAFFCWDAWRREKVR